jgi:TPP-dependent pyruvate/acetoin dehydrogenase alpha subunit
MQITTFPFSGSIFSFAGAGATSTISGSADASSSSSSNSIADAFRNEAKKTPIERIREQVMKNMGVTEDQLKQMPKDQSDAIEKMIDDEVARRVKELSAAQTGQFYDVSA